jgi:hypothetical protein
MAQDQINVAVKGTKAASAARRAEAKSANFKSITGTEAARKAKSNIDDLISQSTRVVEDVLSSSAKEAKKAQESALEIGRESFENFSKSTDAALNGLNQLFDMGKDSADAAVESANIAAEVTQSISSELSDLANSVIAAQFKALENFLSCKTVSDIFNLQSNYLKDNVDGAFERTVKLAELALRYSDAAEPFNEVAAKAGDKLSKAFTPKKK